MPKSLTVNVFGTPAVLRDGRVLSGPGTQRRRMALVAILVVAAPPGRAGVSRERLVELLWPTSDEERSRASLSQALYAIRREVGADDAIVGSGELRLNADVVQSDYWDFLRAIDEGEDSVAATLRHAPLLDGFDLPESPAFAFWVDEARGETERLWTSALSHAAESAERRQEWESAVRWRRAQVNADPLSARAALALARVLVAAGERELALRHLGVHEMLVRQELDAVPDQEITRFAEALRQGEVSPAVSVKDLPRGARHASPLDAPVESPSASPEPSSHTPADTAGATHLQSTSPERSSAPFQHVTPLPPASPPARRRRSIVTVAFALAVGMAALALVMRSFDAASTRDATARVNEAANRAGTQDEMPVIAVGDVAGDSLGRVAAGMLATNLARASGVEVIAASRMLELAAEVPAADPGARALGAARLAGASDVVDGTLLRAGDQWRLELRRTAVATGRVSQAVRVEGRDVFSLVDRASAEMLSGLQRVAPATPLAEVSTPSMEAWRLYEEGVRANTDGRRDAAVAQLRGALAADSTFAIAALTLAAVLGGDDPEYMPLLRQAVRMSDHATPRDAMLIRAGWLGQTDDPRYADVMDSLAARYPSDLEVQLNVAGPALFQQADFGRALGALEGVWRADSARLGRCARSRCYAREALIHIGTVLHYADSLPTAEAWARRYIRVAPADWLGWDRLAEALERQGKYASLEVAVDSATRLGHAQARAYLVNAAIRRGDTVAFNRAFTTQRLGDTERATLEPWDRAVLYRNLGRWEEALREARSYRRMASRLPGETGKGAATLEATVLLEMRRGAEAGEIWEAIARLPRPDQTPSEQARRRVWYSTLAATARFEAGDTTGLAALADSLSVLGLRSGHARDRALHHHVRGLAYLGRGNYEESIPEFQRAIVFPSTGFTRSNWYLARALVASGRGAEARRWLEAALRAPRDGSSMFLNPLAVQRALAALPP